jgi:transposase InsO family protein
VAVDRSTGEVVASEAATGRWLPIAVAAQRAGKNVGLVRRWLLEQDWLGKGLARRVKLASGQPGYEVDEGADARFSLVKSADVLTEDYRTTDDFRQLPEHIRQRAMQREELLRKWARKLAAGVVLGLTEQQVTQGYLNECAAAGITVSRRSLYNWRQSYQSNGLRGLVDQWGMRKGKPDVESFFGFGREMYLTTHRYEKTECFAAATYQADLHGWQKMSYRSFCRKIEQIPKVEVIKRREGEKAFVATAEPSILRDYTSIPVNGWWCSDDHTFDVLVIVGHNEKGKPILKRPTLHAWEDLRSRRIVGWNISADAATAITVVRTFREAVREHGRPGTVYLDNGKSFDNKRLQGVTKHQRSRGKRPGDLTPEEMQRVGGMFNTLGCEVVHAWKYHGQSKPIERQFREVCHKFSKYFGSYVGSHTLDKPDLFLDPAWQRKMVKRGDALTLEDFTACFGDWLETSYHARPHTGHGMDGRTPMEVYTAELGTVDRVPDELLEWATFTTVGPVKVTKNGVTWKGAIYGHADPRLVTRLKQPVMLRIDPDNVAHVYVCDMDGSLICRAEAYKRMPFGANEEMLKAAIRTKKVARRIVRQSIDERPRMVMSHAELMYEAKIAEKRRREAAQPPPAALPPASVKRVQTPFDDQMNAIQKAVNPSRGRVAVGAENVDLDVLSRLQDTHAHEATDTFALLARAVNKDAER